jgi:hypothetical protein
MDRNATGAQQDVVTFRVREHDERLASGSFGNV